MKLIHKEMMKQVHNLRRRVWFDSKRKKTKEKKTV